MWQGETARHVIFGLEACIIVIVKLATYLIGSMLGIVTYI